MAQKKGSATAKNGRDSESKRLGVKKFGGEYVIPGNIIIRQRGTKYIPGSHVGLGKDHTIYALLPGLVEFTHKHKNGKKRTVVNIIPDMEFIVA